MNTEYSDKIKLIAIVDDNAANRTAAIVAISELLPRCKVVEFSSAADAIASINAPTEENPLPDLVFSDMRMENDRSGWQVATVAWSWRIPATIVSGGFKGHGGDSVVLGYPSGHLFVGEKDDSKIWKQVIEAALSGQPTNNALLTALKLGKLEFPDGELGKIASVAVVGSVILSMLGT